MAAAHILERISQETVAHHADADADIDRFLFRRNATVVDYRVYLSRLYGFLVPLEAALAATPGLDEVVEIGSRVKAPHVIHDLLALDLTVEDLGELAQCTSIPVFRGPAAALGWMYVSERTMLASAVIRRHLATHLQLEMASAAHYLTCYAGKVGTRWRELGVAMDHHATTPTIADRIVLAAHDAFRCLHRWRTYDLQHPAGIRFAV